MILKNKKAFTLIELVISLLLSSIIVFFSYTMMTTSYKMFSGLHKTSYNLNNIRFFEAAMRKSITGACKENPEYNPSTYHGYYYTPEPKPIRFTDSKKRLVVRRYDSNVKSWATDTYYFSNGAQFKAATSDYDTFPEDIKSLSAPTNLMLEVAYDFGVNIRMLLLKNVRAFYYSFDKTDRPASRTDDLIDLTIGIVYDDDSTNVLKRQNRTFCFTARSVYEF